MELATLSTHTTVAEMKGCPGPLTNLRMTINVVASESIEPKPSDGFAIFRNQFLMKITLVSHDRLPDVSSEHGQIIPNHGSRFVHGQKQCQEDAQGTMVFGGISWATDMA